MRIQSLLLPAILLLMPLTAFSTNFNFLENSATQQFNKKDWELFNAAFDSAMKSTPDGAKKSWSNPANGDHGYLQPLSSSTKNGKPCRKIKIVSYVSSIQTPDNYIFLFCKSNGDWRLSNE